ncbi:hypothetical protein VFPFJ_01752 [Purpureocillium lilacinum]|nr:hypothetical protein VFPFJ_01752 [Purpureocillium lilacinum]OAQ71539.1 hypothetical protein VFPBJ_10318 [Purpureocillium lilacinum]OAQ92591.1 hypothetical protein VFPFJ_01752 [Purpureocillium lilacinum]
MSTTTLVAPSIYWRPPQTLSGPLQEIWCGAGRVLSDPQETGSSPARFAVSSWLRPHNMLESFQSKVHAQPGKGAFMTCTVGWYWHSTSHDQAARRP